MENNVLKLKYKTSELKLQTTGSLIVLNLSSSVQFSFICLSPRGAINVTAVHLT